MNSREDTTRTVLLVTTTTAYYYYYYYYTTTTTIILLLLPTNRIYSTCLRAVLVKFTYITGARTFATPRDVTFRQIETDFLT